MPLPTLASLASDICRWPVQPDFRGCRTAVIWQSGGCQWDFALPSAFTDRHGPGGGLVPVSSVWGTCYVATGARAIPQRKALDRRKRRVRGGREMAGRAGRAAALGPRRRALCLGFATAMLSWPCSVLYPQCVSENRMAAAGAMLPAISATRQTEADWKPTERKAIRV